MPRKKDGAVLIGFAHAGIKNAKKVADVLENSGFKKGDLVALEGEKSHSFWVAENGERELKKLKRSIEDAERTAEKLLERRNSKEYLQMLIAIKKAKHEQQTLEFEVELGKFLQEKEAKLLFLDTGNLLKSKRKMMGGREAKKEGEFEAIPKREQQWKKILCGKKPAFVLAGTVHLVALKRMLPYQKASSSQTNL